MTTSPKGGRCPFHLGHERPVDLGIKIVDKLSEIDRRGNRTINGCVPQKTHLCGMSPWSRTRNNR